MDENRTTPVGQDDTGGPGGAAGASLEASAVGGSQGGPADGFRAALQVELRRAMKARDTVTVAAVRSVLAAIANAEAVPIGSAAAAGALEASPVGVGAAEADRLVLGEEDVSRVVRAEVDERLSAATQVESIDPERALRLRDEAQLVARLWSDLQA